MVILLILLKVYKATQKGATVTDSVTKEQTEMHVISYVDDNSIVRHFEQGTTVPQMMSKIKDNLGEWQKLLQLTGGDLSLDKCKVTFLAWYQNGEWGRVQMEKIAPEEKYLEVRSVKNDAKAERMERLEPTHAERVLGIRLPLSGSMKTELNYRKKQLKNFCTKLYRSPLSQKDAYSAYQSRYKSIASYPYPVTTFTTSNINEIQSTAMRLLLPKLGMNRNMPRAVVYGPRKYGGRQITDLRIEQPVKSLTSTIGHLRRNDRVGKLLLATLRDLQIECGREILIFELDPNDYGYVTSATRWKYTWEIAHEFQVQIKVAQCWIPTPRYENDKNIMKAAIEDPLYQGKNRYKLVTINQCRMYQQAFFISDLLLQNSSTIVDKDYFNGNKQHIHPMLKMDYYLKPTKLQWNEWRSFIYRNFLAGIYAITPPIGNAIAMNDDYMTTDINMIGQTLRCKDTLEATIDTLPPTMKQIIGKATCSANRSALLEHLHNGTLIGASDGSVIDDNFTSHGAHAFVLGSNMTGQNFITGYSKTPESTTIASLTTELYGLIAATLTILCISKYYMIEQIDLPPIYIYSDNEQAIEMANKQEDPINISDTLKFEYDLQGLLHQIKHLLPVTVKYQWVKAHQDELTTSRQKIFGPFQRHVEMNIIADSLANKASKLTRHDCLQRPTYSSTAIGVYTKQGVFIGDLQEQLTLNMHGNDLLEYLTQKHQWNNTSIQTINWSVLKSVIDTYQPYYQTKICQLMHDWQYIGERKELMYDKENKCPTQCGHREGKMHYLWCTDTQMTLKRNKLLRTLQKQLQATNTCPGINSIFTRIFKHGFEDSWGDGIEDGTALGTLLAQAYHQQRALGKNSLAKGYLVHKWQTAQTEWLTVTGSIDVQSKHWMRQAIISIHTYSYGTWKLRNDILHKDKVKSKTAQKRSRLQERIANLYNRGRANLTRNELKYFNLPVEQRQKKGIENMMLWVTMVESIFRKRGEATQLKLDTWLTGTTPIRTWKDKYKDTQQTSKNLVDGLGGSFLDPR